MSRAAEQTRAELLDAAVTVFALHGFEAGSVREIARRADANAAAVSYHFGGKDGLYREVLRRSVAAFDLPSFDAATTGAMPRDAAVRAFVSGQLAALRRHGEVARYLRIFAWENLSRSPVFADILATERLPIVDSARDIVARYLGDAGTETQRIALIWLLHQVEPFIRNPGHVSGPPFQLKLDGPFIARLGDELAAVVIAGLESLAARAQSAAAGTA